MTVALKDGTSVKTKDFIHNGISFEDPANKGQFYLAGTNGLCYPNGVCPVAASTTDFTIIYYQSSQSFVIGLTKEPLGSLRSEAEQFLMNTLGISEQQMCSLTYTLGTTVYVNPTYGGENLGFSFCPGAVKLPQ